MKTTQRSELLIVTIVCTIFLPGLTGCSPIAYTGFYRPTIFAHHSISTTQIQELNHHKLTNQIISENITYDNCPKWDTRGRRYNTKTVETIHGKVLRVDSMTPRHRMSQGVHLQFKTSNGVIPVHLGPSWYIENQEIEIKPNDTLKIVGSRINFDGEQVIIAAQITKEETTVKLRDTNGFPVWSGGRKQEYDWNKEGFPYLC